MDITKDSSDASDGGNFDTSSQVTYIISEWPTSHYLANVSEVA